MWVSRLGENKGDESEGQEGRGEEQKSKTRVPGAGEYG